ncbi:exopolysaccharide biosynthesis protein YbjH [Idiomarina aquatica]|uniref:Exopolysaccharide biosynthesis protein YbjH n=1 Tax=Idiomarina aquatica TaxID=1327752 RepID=A0A4R6PQD7_9GAMM|nr:YjbH domain-containing protein [Idiomarina aquatica]TDP40204.1 exopolysaccharide biosynthesis protein YbjH [Idiomarina aquatica]
MTDMSSLRLLRKFFSCTRGASYALLLTATTAVAQQPSQSDVGGVGLMQMPTARMNREGEFTAFYYDNDEYRRMGLSIQLFPWMEATLRYNDVRTRRYSPFPNFSGDQTYKDRGVDVKFRLLEESQWLPEFSLGMRDIAGTGRFAGEYLAASKRLGPLDFTLGLGFGYLGREDNIDNPFCEAAERFCDRNTDFGEGGDFQVDDWFSGPAALFGGVEYQTPWQPLSVKIEYDGNDYKTDYSGTPIIQDSNWNYGLHYRVANNLNLQLSYERGNTWMFGFNLRTNFNDISQVKVTPPISAPTNPAYTSLDDVDTRQLAIDIYKNSGFGVFRITQSDDGRTVSVYGYQAMYLDHQMSIDRATAVLANTLPPSVTEYRFIDTARQMELAQISVDAQTYKRAHYRADITTRYEDSYRLVDVDRGPETAMWERNYKAGWPHFGARPFLEQSFGGPENFYMYQLRLDTYIDWMPTENFRLDSVVSASLLTNYDDFRYLVDGNDTGVPRVRTYVREYATMSDVWLSNLQATYATQINQDVYASVYGGYLERMFGGIGTEWMYRELDSNWAVGVDINYARQRSFETHFGFRDYDVITGHVTGYYEPEFWPETRFKIAVGRFLAKDKGVQVQMEKKFDSGMIVGAYAAKTNLSAEEFGEGSFTKGFYISIPFDLFQMRHSGKRATIGWTPLTRDGGQMLGRRNTLDGLTDARSRYYTDWD